MSSVCQEVCTSPARKANFLLPSIKLNKPFPLKIPRPSVPKRATNLTENANPQLGVAKLVGTIFVNLTNLLNEISIKFWDVFPLS